MGTDLTMVWSACGKKNLVLSKSLSCKSTLILATIVANSKVN